MYYLLVTIFYELMYIFISDRTWNNRKYKKVFGKNVDYSNPKTYNEKLQWLKLYHSDPLAGICADKFRVREYVREKYGEDILNTVYGVYKDVESIPFDDLPKEFVLKGTHGSAMTIICTDKDNLDIQEAKTEMRFWLRTNYYKITREWPYKNIERQIICEKYLGDKDGRVPDDYKIYCFDGEPKFIQVDENRFTSEHSMNFYGTDWNLWQVRDVLLKKNQARPAPLVLDEMLDIARKLSKGFIHVRVDLYIVGGTKVLFGELTFFTGDAAAMVDPMEYDYIWGSYLKLPNQE